MIKLVNFIYKAVFGKQWCHRPAQFSSLMANNRARCDYDSGSIHIRIGSIQITPTFGHKLLRLTLKDLIILIILIYYPNWDWMQRNSNRLHWTYWWFVWFRLPLLTTATHLQHNFSLKMVFENQNDIISISRLFLFNLKYVTSTTSRFSSTKVAYKMSNQVEL